MDLCYGAHRMLVAAWGLLHLWCSDSLVLVCQLSCPRILVPLPGIKPTSPALEGKLLTPGAPGKSLNPQFLLILLLEVRTLLLISLYFFHHPVPGNHQYNLCFYKFFFFRTPQVSDTMQNLSFSDISLSTMPSKSISVVTSGKFSFFFLWLSSIPF